MTQPAQSPPSVTGASAVKARPASSGVAPVFRFRLEVPENGMPPSIVNTGASIDHDGVLGTAVHVAPGARLAGNVTLEDGVFVGIGAVIVPGRTIGAWTRVGAGAAVVHDLPANVTAIGVPARAR